MCISLLVFYICTMFFCLASVPTNIKEFDSFMVAYSGFRNSCDLYNSFISWKVYKRYKDLTILRKKTNYYNYYDYFIVPTNDKSRILYFARNQKNDKYILSYYKKKRHILRKYLKIPLFYDKITMYIIISYNNINYPCVFYSAIKSDYITLKNKLRYMKKPFYYIVLSRKYFYKFIKDYSIKDINSIIRKYVKIKNSGNDNIMNIWKDW